MADGSTQFDVSFFPLPTGNHAAAADDITAKLEQASSDGDWKIAWMVTTSEGVIMVLQRPTPAPPPAKVSLGAYASGS
ncbi:hypothetical protein PPGU19_063580 (plasmid) [Paraburkholderia sp. PGU19]|uniref:hypothetical protein n=1 Tax=Paraburkholderia sp. PGU19 TaxID=2735434 RepID=UPI0015DB496C|nr:hypothetical protein [Paraburkholderia sp. PGU19]BCG01790.1 hypothetical protein PPGU19_063580 [Paraburkholderia sp. PGU19]